jgi:hypothetical protein
MKIETTVKGLTKAKRQKLDGLVAFDETTGLATFEWRADENPPHDYASAFARVRAEVADAGGECGEPRILS